MIARHTFKMTALCPKGGQDFYTVEVEVGRFVPVERLHMLAATFKDTPIYQEYLTTELAAKIRDCKVTLTGLHGGVSTVTTAESA